MAEAQDDKPSWQQREFFRNTISDHDKVDELEEITDQLYKVRRVGDLSDVVVYITNLYTVGYADVANIKSHWGDVNCIVTMSNWNSYSGDARRFAAESNIGLFQFAEFMGALNLRQVWKYSKRENYGTRRSR